MAPQPHYVAEDIDPNYRLYYDWTGWPSQTSLPPEPDSPLFDALADQWEGDGIRPLEWNWDDDQVQLCASVEPSVTPVTCAARIKGRLQHALRKANTPVKFSRNLSVLTVGESNSERVETYIEEQVDREELADPSFAEFLEQFTVCNTAVDLSEATKTGSGRYWYNLHIVLVYRDRYRITDEDSLATLRDGSLKIADKKGHRIASLAVMPDHLHMALRGDVSQSPEEIALGFMNNLAHLMGQVMLWEPSYHVSTFGAYDMWAIRSGQSSGE